MTESRLTDEEAMNLERYPGLHIMYLDGCSGNVIRPIMEQLDRLCGVYPEAAEKMRNLQIADTGIILFRLVCDTAEGQTTIRKFITNDFSYALQRWLVQQTAHVEFDGYAGEACEVYSEWVEGQMLSGEISAYAGHNPYESFATAFISYYCSPEPAAEADTRMVVSVQEIIRQIRASGAGNGGESDE